MPDPIRLPDDLTAGVPRLRAVEERDVPAVVAACGDPEIQRFTRVPTPYTAEDARDFVAISQQGLADGTGVALAVTDEDDVLAGSTGLEIDWRVLTADVGYWLAPRARGRGLMTAAVRRLTRFAFDDLGLEYLGLSAATVNTASNRVAQRCGFSLEGTLRGAGLLGDNGDRTAPRADMNVYGLRPDDREAP